MPDPARRQARLDAGRCGACGQSPPAPDHTACPACLDLQRRAEAHRRRQLRADGICLDCRRAPASAGRYRCDACAEAQARRMRRQSQGATAA